MLSFGHNSMIATIQRRYSLDEYRAIADTAEEKCEYHDGEIVAMTGRTVKHSRIGEMFLLFLNYYCETPTLKRLTTICGSGFLIISVAYTQMRWFLLGLCNLMAVARMKF